MGQVPKDCSAITFLEQLQLHNILDYINFFYMPVDKAKRRSCGYVFLDFRHPSDVLRFKSKLKKIGMGIGAAKSGRKLHVHFAHMQGWKELLERYSEPEYLFHPDANERPQLFFRRRIRATEPSFEDLLPPGPGSQCWWVPPVPLGSPSSSWAQSAPDSLAEHLS